MPSVFSVKNLSVRLSKKEILHSISLDIAEKSCTAIIGPNGAGKTTLLKCL
ncbi:MAG TPA: ATP-binding cassette domain-containing protein, partial [Candidatus Hydrogenedentes bacterium]|nr:ATP-binding cassette domain-containing protein [Candidatus Hydrogenedentota bacterium]